MLIHCVFISIFQIIIIAFEKKPAFYVIIIELYLNFVFAIDILRIFSTPLQLATGKVTYKRKIIAMKYLQEWFIFDLFAFYPMAYLRYISDYDKGGFNVWENWIT